MSQTREAVLRESMSRQVEALRSRQLSATELVRATLSAIEQCNPALNALVTLRPEEALAEAGDADAAIGRGAARRLEGIPFTVKDLIATAGVRTTAGSLLLREHVPNWSA